MKNQNYPTSNQRELSLEEKRREHNRKRQLRAKEREMNHLKNSLKREVSGKPNVPAGDITAAGLLGKFFGKGILIVLIVIVLIIAILGASLIGILVGYINTATEVPSSLFVINEQTSYIYDKDGNEMAALTGSSNINREIVAYQEVSSTYIDEAFIAIEDRTFDTNIGIDPRRIAGAVISAVANLGESSYGGSTITQQTIKMLTGDDDVSYQRKVQEWYRAVRLTDQLSKAEIMSLYLNLVPMGNNFVGIQSAAKAYFGKNASEINLAEAALLAGLPKSPSSYNPRTELGRKNGQRRQRIVLNSMLETGAITANQFEDALNYDLVYSAADATPTGSEIQSYYEEFVIEQVTEDLVEIGYPENIAYQMVQNGGLQIHTAFDSNAQDFLDEKFMDPNTLQLNPAMYASAPEVPQSGIVVLDNENNTVVAMQGGFGEKRANLVLNRATDITRQPGSAIKPIAVYAPAIDMDLLSGATIIVDEPLNLDIRNPDVIWPNNAYNSFYGNMTIREALKISNNVPATKVLHEVGVSTAKDYMYQVGIDLRNDPVGLALATGATTYGISPWQLANAFKTFTTGGLYAEAKSYTRVMDDSGNVLLENNPRYEQVYSSETSYMTLKLLEEVLRGPRAGVRYSGTNSNLSPVTNANGEAISTSGKSGTTNDRIDSWGVQQTPYYTVAAWQGFDNRIKQTSLNGYLEARMVHQLINDTLQYIHQDLPAADWTRPAGIVELNINPSTGLLAGGGGYTEYFKAGSAATPNHSASSTDDINYLRTDAIPNYYDDFAENNGYE